MSNSARELSESCYVLPACCPQMLNGWMVDDAFGGASSSSIINRKSSSNVGLKEEGEE